MGSFSRFCYNFSAFLLKLLTNQPTNLTTTDDGDHDDGANDGDNDDGPNDERRLMDDGNGQPIIGFQKNG